MLKRLLTLSLAAAMVLSMASVGLAATDVKYAVYSMFDEGYLKDDDGYIDLDHPSTSNTAAYGETIYFPLYNTGYANHNAADAKRTEAEKAYNTAKAAYEAAEAEYNTAKATAADKLKAYNDAVTDGQTYVTTVKGLFDTAKGKYKTYVEKSSAKSAAESAATGITHSLADATDLKNTWTGYQTTGALRDQLTNDKTTVTNAFADSGEGLTEENKSTIAGHISTALSTTYTIPTECNADTLNSKIDEAISKINENANTYTTEYNKLKAVDDATTALNTATNDYEAALTAINNKCNTSYTVSYFRSEDAFDTEKNAKAVAPDISSLKSASDAAAEAETEALRNKNAAETTMNEKEIAYEAAKAAVSDTYAFVYESDAVEKVKATGSWSVGKKYVDSISIERVKATCKSGAYGLGVSYKIYCVAITIKDSTTTKTADIGGTVKLSGKSGTTKVNDEVGIDITIDYESADSSNDGVIYAKAMLFEDGNGFDEDDEFEFTFDEDDDCYFVVNTNSQKSIVLGFDCDYDDDIGDKIAKKNPSADLDFYNGNYARFSKTGTLYLGGYESKKYYVYSISSSGALSRADASYDSDEEAFVIRTNTLGRYIVSTEKLSSSLTSSDDDESSSTTKTSTASATASTTTKTSTATSTTTKTSTTTSVTSKPASSTPASSKPASSSVPASSTASSSSSTETEVSSSEETSEEEPSSEEYEDVVIDTDEEEDDVPTKEGGISWLVWVLIFAGLAAVLIAVGVIFYTHRNSGKRML